MAISKAESTPFLYASEGDVEGCAHHVHENHRDKSCNGSRKLHITYGLNVVFLVINIFFLAYNCYPALQADDLDQLKEPFSPAREIVNYTVQSVKTHLDDYPYAGKPRPEFDRAWSQLLHGTMIVVSEDELQKANKTSIKTPDGRGYVAYVEAFHQLHCVKRLVQMRDPAYYSNLKPEELNDEHFNHCIEVLRTGIMCRADLTLNTYRWDESKPDKITGLSEGPRTCVDWGHLHTWAKERALSPAEVRHFRQIAP